MRATCGSPLEWYGLYSKDYDLCTPESMSHPAKASWDLAFKINEHLEELGLLKPADTVIDIMAGTSRIPIAACAKGYRAIAVELEEKFCAMSEANREYASKKLGREIDLKIIQGDARRLSELLRERGLIGEVSPPYGDQVMRGDSPDRKYEIVSEMVKKGGKVSKRSLSWLKGYPKGQQKPHYQQTGQGQYNPDNPANIGNLSDRPLKAITSPPYEDVAGRQSHGGSGYHGKDIPSKTMPRYGEAEGQIGQEQQENYLSAMRRVYAEALKVCSVLVVIIKNPTRQGKLRRLDSDTLSLLQETGWTLVCRHRAMLFTELEQASLFGGTKKKLKGRVSVFKLLSYRKGSPIAQWEDVFFCVRDGEGLVGEVSPPYQDITVRHLEKSAGKAWEENARGAHKNPTGYGTTPGQIGSLR